MKYVIRLPACTGSQYVFSYSNALACPLMTAAQHALYFDTIEEAQRWASRYLVAYSWEVVRHEAA